jgi:iron complex transport system ATP-binding protein
VAFGRYPHCRGNPGPEDHRQIALALSTLGLEPLADRFLDQLSGGQRQRAHIAMVLAQDTDCILLDEPLNNLDISHAVRIITLVREAARSLGKTVVVELHDINMAAAHCDRIVVMKAGRVLRHGPPEAVMEDSFLSEVYETPIRVHQLDGRLLALY